MLTPAQGDELLAGLSEVVDCTARGSTTFAAALAAWADGAAEVLGIVGPSRRVRWRALAILASLHYDLARKSSGCDRAAALEALAPLVALVRGYMCRGQA